MYNQNHLDELYMTMSTIINGVDIDSLKLYVKINGLEKSIILFDQIIDYVNGENLKSVSKDEINPICRKLNMPYLFSSELGLDSIPIPLEFEKVSLSQHLKENIYLYLSMLGLLVSSEILLYGLNLFLPEYNIFNKFSPLPIILITVYLIFNSSYKELFNSEERARYRKIISDRHSSRKR